MKVDYKDNSQQILSAMEKGKRNALTAIGATAETYAKKATPVDTGRLRNSISHSVDGEAAYSTLVPIATSSSFGVFLAFASP